MDPFVQRIAAQIYSSFATPNETGSVRYEDSFISASRVESGGIGMHNSPTSLLQLSKGELLNLDL